MQEQDLLTTARDYASALGIKLSTLGILAFNNSRYFDRLERRREKDAEDEARLRAYMAANPPEGVRAAE